jgi:hypothetical protein
MRYIRSAQQYTIPLSLESNGWAPHCKPVMKVLHEITLEIQISEVHLSLTECKGEYSSWTLFDRKCSFHSELVSACDGELSTNLVECSQKQ